MQRVDLRSRNKVAEEYFEEYCIGYSCADISLVLPIFNMEERTLQLRTFQEFLLETIGEAKTVQLIQKPICKSSSDEYWDLRR